MKRVSLILLFILLLQASIVASIASYPAVVINDQLLSFDSVRVVDSSYYVEIKELLKNCDLDFWFIDDDKSVTIFSEASTITFYCDKTILHDGINYSNPDLLIIDNGCTYISIREFARIIGYKSFWVQDHMLAKLSTSKAYDNNYISEDLAERLVSNRMERETIELEKMNQQMLKDIEDGKNKNATEEKKASFTLPPLKPDIKPPSDSSKVAYLTFDDGPSSTTPKVLDILDKYNVKATFFVIGANAEKNPEIIKRIHEEGHAIANHTYSHDNNKLYRGPYYFWEELYKTNNILKEIIGVQTKMVRVPYGSSNFTSTYLEYIKNRDDYKIYGWNIDSQDSLPGGRTAEQIYLNTINGIKRNANPLILFHDSSGKSETLRALPHIIEYLWENGYNIVPLDYNTELKGVIR